MEQLCELHTGRYARAALNSELAAEPDAEAVVDLKEWRRTGEVCVRGPSGRMGWLTGRVVWLFVRFQGRRIYEDEDAELSELVSVSRR